MHMDMALLHTTLNEPVWIYNSGGNYIYKQFWRIRVNTGKSCVVRTGKLLSILWMRV